MAKVTLVKNYRNKETFNQCELSTIDSNIQSQTFGKVCRETSQAYPFAEVRQHFGETDNTIMLWSGKLLKVCFLSVI